MRADDLRRSLLSAVSHDLRTPLAAAKVAVSSLRAEDIAFSPEDTAELLATIEESIDQLTALVGNLLDSSRLAAGVVHPDLSRVYLEESVQRALVSIGKGATGFYRSAIDRVKVDVGDAVVMADAGLLERVFANLIDNALRYAPNSVKMCIRDRSAIGDPLRGHFQRGRHRGPDSAGAAWCSVYAQPRVKAAQPQPLHLRPGWHRRPVHRDQTPRLVGSTAPRDGLR